MNLDRGLKYQNKALTWRRLSKVPHDFNRKRFRNNDPTLLCKTNITKLSVVFMCFVNPHQAIPYSLFLRKNIICVKTQFFHQHNLSKNYIFEVKQPPKFERHEWKKERERSESIQYVQHQTKIQRLIGKNKKGKWRRKKEYYEFSDDALVD